MHADTKLRLMTLNDETWKLCYDGISGTTHLKTCCLQIAGGDCSSPLLGKKHKHRKRFRVQQVSKIMNAFSIIFDFNVSNTILQLSEDKHVAVWEGFYAQQTFKELTGDTIRT